MATDVIKQVVAIRADLSGLRTDLTRTESEFKSAFSRIQTVASGALGALGIGLSVGGFIAFGKSVVDLAGKLTDLEDQTGISAQLLSGMNSTLEEAGTSADAFAKGVFTAQRNLGLIKTDTDEAALAVHALGLNLNELRNASPQQFLELIAQALAKIDNPVQRAALGSAVLGRSFKELTPIISQLAGRFEEFKAAGMTADDLKRLDAFGDSITRLKNEVMVLASGPLAALANGIAILRNTLRGEGPQGFEALESSVKNLTETVARSMGIDVGRVLMMTTEQLEEMGRKAPGAARAVISSLIAARQQLNAFIAKTPLGTGPSNEPKARAPFVPLGDPAAEKKAAADAKKILEDAAKATADAIDEAQKAAEAAGADMIEVFKALKKEGLTPAEEKIADINARFDELVVKAVNAGQVTGQSMAPFIEQLEFFRRQAQLLANTPTTGADLLDAERGEEIRAQEERLREFGRTMADLNQRQHESSQLSLALGNAFDSTSDRISIQRQRVEALVKQYGALHPAVAEAVAALRQLEQQQVGEELFSRLSGSLERGIADTVRGINEGSQTLNDGMRNLARNMVLSFQEELLKLSVLNPIKNWLMGMLNMTGDRAPVVNLAGLLGGANSGPQQLGGPPPDDQANLLEDAWANINQVMQQGILRLGSIGQSGFGQLFSGLGSILSEGLSSLGGLFSGGGDFFGSIFSGIFSGIGGLLGFERGGLVPALASLPRFDNGGLAVMHPGEFVLRQPAVQRLGIGNAMALNETGRLPQGGGSPNVSVQVTVNGSITPNNPNAKRDEIITTVVRDLDNQGKILRTFERRTNIKGGG